MKIEIELDERRIADLLETALHGGIWYWAHIKRVCVCARTMDAAALVSGECVVDFTTVDDKTIRRLDRGIIERGLLAMMTKAPRHFGNWLAEREDAETGDVFVQCCLFGEIVYG